MKKDSKIYVAGHTGLVGSALIRDLFSKGYENILTMNHAQLDLVSQQEVDTFFSKTQPEYVFIAAAKVGGIWENNLYPAEFYYTNIMIQTNIIQAAYRYGVKKLLFLGSSCIYPQMAPQPIKEEYLLSGLLESTNEAYAIAKISGVKMCAAYKKQYGCNYLCAMPTNLYGPGDNYDKETSHALPGIIHKIHDAKVNNENEITLWGSGTPLREFLYSGDLADACVFLMEKYDAEDIGECINIGCGKDIMIHQLAKLIAKIVGYKGELKFDNSRPDGTPRKLLDVSMLTKLGWTAKTKIEDGIKITYQDFLKNEINM